MALSSGDCRTDLSALPLDLKLGSWKQSPGQFILKPQRETASHQRQRVGPASEGSRGCFPCWVDVDCPLMNSREVSFLCCVPRMPNRGLLTL